MSRRRRALARVLPPCLSAGVAALLILAGWLSAPPAVAAGPDRPAAAAGVLAAKPHVPSGDELEDMKPVAQVVTIMVGTLISEDLTCITVGLLMRQGHLSPWVGGLACFLGIYVGDLALFLAGRLFGRGLLRFKLFSHGFGAAKLEEFGRWFERKPWAALAMCRIAPGLRMPLFLAVGALTKKTGVFFWWTCFFAFVWTPLLIGLVYVVGEQIIAPFHYFFGGGWLSILLAVITLFVTIRLVTLLSTKEGRLKIRCRIDKLLGRPSTCEEPLTEPDSHKHPPGVAPVVHASPKLAGDPMPMPDAK
ncbi:MAG TPA: DedA family protein [Humisphaera sp.]